MTRRQLLTGGVACLVAAVLTSGWLFSGETHVPAAGTVGSWVADVSVVLLVAASGSLTRRGVRRGGTSAS